jgi:LmbE family N-acetylglucosaminyl deacetylase
LTSKADGGGPILAFGAHPDDIEFGCGAVIFAETKRGRPAHFVVTSRGEAATNGTPEQREQESRKAAEILGATIEFLALDTDSHLEIKLEHTLALAAIIRSKQPSVVLAPTCVENQHPDHSKLGKMVRDAARLARYGGMTELARAKPWSIDQLLFYAITPNAVPAEPPILIDISDDAVVSAWTAAMNAHASQAATRNYVEMQLTRARYWGAQAGVTHAVALYPNDLMLFDSLSATGKGARRF